jgi:hypothetical protein
MALSTEKTDLDLIVQHTDEISNNTSATMVNTDQTNNPFFQVFTGIQRPANVTAYAVNQAYSTAAASSAFLQLAQANHEIEITEILVTDDNTNASITPQVVLSEFASNVFFTVQVIPSTLAVLNNVLVSEIISGTVLVKIAGNAGNMNFVRFPTPNIKIKTDADSKIYFGIIAIAAFTPKSGQTLALTIKGRYL